MPRLVRLFLSLALLTGMATAHVGSSDIYLDGSAGPYKLFVTIRPPQVIPGVAELLIRSQSPEVTQITAVPLPLVGPGADHAPIPDALTRASADPHFFTGSLWLMNDGCWQVRLSVSGSKGPGTLSIPVSAVAQTTRRMDLPLGIILSLIGLFLVGGFAAICGATVCEAKLEPGIVPTEARRRKGRLTMLIAFGVILAVLISGDLWWASESSVFQKRIYKPLNMQARLNGASGLLLNLSEPGWMQPQSRKQVASLNRVSFIRKIDDLVPDHNHLMHLYLIREPGLDVIYHLHPDQVQPDAFQLALPSLPAGDYRLFADVVHANGLPETLTSSLHLANGISPTAARPLSGDDATAETQPIHSATLSDTFTLPDGYRMHWIHPATQIHAREGTQFEFELLKPDGSAPQDMAPYMGMLGHAAFVKDDCTVFAHIHPNGTVSMSAFMLAQGSGSMQDMQHSQMNMALPNRVAFPYGLPTPGQYRIFVQMKHAATIETGIFDTTAN